MAKEARTVTKAGQLVQSGSVPKNKWKNNSDQSGTITIKFPITYKTPPNVVVSPWYDGTALNVVYPPTISEITTEHFTVASSNYGVQEDIYHVNWIAMGQPNYRKVKSITLNPDSIDTLMSVTLVLKKSDGNLALPITLEAGSSLSKNSVTKTLPKALDIMEVSAISYNIKYPDGDVNVEDDEIINQDFTANSQFTLSRDGVRPKYTEEEGSLSFG